MGYKNLSLKRYKIAPKSYYGRRTGSRTDASNGTSLNDLELPVTQISRLRYYLTSNNSKMIQDRAIVTMGTNKKSYMVNLTAPLSMTLNDPINPDLKVRAFLTLNISEMAKDTAIVTMECE